MPGVTLPASQERIIAKLVARVEQLERKINMRGTVLGASGGLLGIFSGDGSGSTPGGSATGTDVGTFDVSESAYVFAWFAGAIDFEDASSGAWTGSAILEIDFAGDVGGSAPWSIPAASIGDEYPVAMVDSWPVSAGSHTLTVLLNSNLDAGFNGSWLVAAFASGLHT